MPGLIDSPTGLANLLAPGSGLIWISGGLSPPGGLGPPSVTDAVIDRFEANILDRFGNDIFTRVVSPTVPSWVLVGGGIPATLDLNFTGNAAWNNGVDTTPAALLTCTRASSGYYTQANGILANFPSNNTLRMGSNGLLVEESRTNSLLQSQTLNVTWTLSAMLAFGSGSVLNATAAPDGTTTAALLIPDTTAGDHAVSQSITVTAASWTLSAYVKAAGYSKFGWRENAVTGAYATFNLSGAGSVISTNLSTATITALTNGWYRVTMTYTGTAASHSEAFYILTNAYTSGSPQGTGLAGDGASGLYLWGFQAELGAFATSYIPTTASTATRAADNISLTLTNAAAYSAYVSSFNLPTVNSARIMGTAGTDLFDIQTATSVGSFNGTTTLTATLGSGTIAGFVKMALGGSATGRAVVANNGTLVTDANPISTFTSLFPESNSGSGSFGNGYMQRFAYWNSQLSNSALQTLTTGPGP